MGKIDGNYTLTALCAVGAEKICAQEIRKLNVSALDKTFHVTGTAYGRVNFQTNLPGIYRALFALRTADRVLLQCASFDAPDFDALFEGAKGAATETLVPKNSGVIIGKVRVNRSKLQAAVPIQAMVHKAVAENLCRAYSVSRLPEYGAGFNAVFRVYLEKDRAELLLDLSGDPLFKRGYREEGGIAPLRETTAAALVLASGWRRKEALYDPFCGSGTIPVEAALYACNLAPNLGRAFALDELLIADAETRREVKENLLQNANLQAEFNIKGCDSNSALITTARSNAKKAFFLAGGEAAHTPLFNALNMEDAKAYGPGSGFVITNPPYGRRLGDLAEAEEGYKKMALLRRNFPGWKIAVITDSENFESLFGEQASSVSPLTNGAVKTYIYQFEKKEAAPPKETAPYHKKESGPYHPKAYGRPDAGRPQAGTGPENGPKPQTSQRPVKEKKQYTW
ncbi:MAG: class I SAM-dependent RNA methyltransferase [Spirochaetaceae bacterium]|jgi:putative N6-adenine-specific DNA methylase|nr:class I SAM-dependent RNA methyltransferase [Spirochaetaceae bacterium]